MVNKPDEESLTYCPTILSSSAIFLTKALAYQLSEGVKKAVKFACSVLSSKVFFIPIS